MFEASSSNDDENIVKYILLFDAECLSYGQVISLWRSNAQFRLFFTALLADAPCAGFRLETPPVTQDSLEKNFEFVLIDSPWLNDQANPNDFAEHFDQAKDDFIVVFENLGKDATLIVPQPHQGIQKYAHLASFVRHAPVNQIHELWKVLADTLKQHLGDRPIWLSTHGGGVDWLHLRLDTKPKYYSYLAYKIK